MQTHRLAVSPAEAARLAGIGRTKLYEALGTSALPSFKLGSRRLVRIVEIDAWLRRLESTARSDR
jgi:excisionase family DNA binding protein